MQSHGFSQHEGHSPASTLRLWMVGRKRAASPHSSLYDLRVHPGPLPGTPGLTTGTHDTGLLEREQWGRV